MSASHELKLYLDRALRRPGRIMLRSRNTGRRLLSFALIGAFLIGPSPAAWTGCLRAAAAGLVASPRNLFNWRSLLWKAGTTKKQDDPFLNRNRVSKLRVTPEKVVIYEGEGMQINCLTSDGVGEVVNGVTLEWSSVNEKVAAVASTGEVTAVSPGRTVVQVTAGTQRAAVPVEVRAGARPDLTDADWKGHGGNADSAPDAIDSSDSRVAPNLTRLQQPTDSATPSPGSVFSQERPHPPSDTIDSEGGLTESASSLLPAVSDVLREVRALVPGSGNPARAAETAAAAPPFIASGIDGDGIDPTQSALAVTSPNNAVGHPRFYARGQSIGGSTRVGEELPGSANYNFVAPVLGLPGRGISASLALVYNAQLWSKDSNFVMSFNSDLGWPTIGWRLGFGRMKHNFDGSGNHLFIEPDGTRRVFFATSDPDLFKTKDGSYLRYNKTNGVLRYHDNVRIKIDTVNNRKLPTQVKTGDGNYITIAYKTYDSVNFPVMWAIDYVRDSLGRYIVFQYDGNARLTSIVTSSSQTGSPVSRTLVKLSYEVSSINYNFGSMTVRGVTPGEQLALLKRIFYPETGTGFVMTYGSPYGMCTHISSRRQMTDFSDGVESAYTDYNYPTSTAAALSDVPRYTQKQEWWESKTDANGTPTSSASVTNYSRSDNPDILQSTFTVTSPDGAVTETVSNNDPSSADFGFVQSSTIRNSSGSQLQRVAFIYTADLDNSRQISEVTTFDETNQDATAVKTITQYGNFGRVKEVQECGFAVSANTWQIRRRKLISYITDTLYTDKLFYYLVTSVEVWDAKGTNSTADDTRESRTEFAYDNFAVTGGMEMYPGSLAPPGYDTAFDTETLRGLQTSITEYPIVTGGGITRYTKRDKFGNAISIDLSCCNKRQLVFSSATYWSLPDSLTEGSQATSAETLTSTFSYDFNTSRLNSTGDPNNVTANFTYDAAGRVTQTQINGLATSNVIYGDSDLTSTNQITYVDQGVSKTLTSKTWFNGLGLPIRSGSGAGSSPSSYDVQAVTYDEMARPRRQSNPYSGDSNGNGSPSYWTVSTLDLLGRTTLVTLPDGATIATQFTANTVTVTDQVGRQRKSEMDGLGRLTRVTEPDPASGSLTLTTDYTYDVLDNLKTVSQGGQSRSFNYDAMSRLSSQSTPEAGTSSYTYTSFNTVQTRTDPRGVVTTYGYDGVNRLSSVSYNTASAPGVASTLPVAISYGSTPPTKGRVASVNFGTGSETYGYDSSSRVSSKSVTIGGVSYPSQYTYNTGSQLDTITYPSGRRLRPDYDTRGRFLALRQVDNFGSIVKTYMSGIGYNSASLVTGLSVGNGLTEQYTYSSDRLQLTNQKVLNGAAALMDFTYNYTGAVGDHGAGATSGNAGQLISTTGTLNGVSRNQTFRYDDLGRLASATGSDLNGPWQRRFVYDRWGNRTQAWNATSGGTQIQQVNLSLIGSAPSNQVASYSDNLATGGVTKPVTYDVAGNVASDGAYTFLYDAENRIAQVNAAGTGTLVATYTYDSANRRIKKVVGSTTTVYVWEGSQVVAEYASGASASSPNTEYIYTGGRMLAEERTGSGTTRFFHQDRLSTRLTTNSSGAVVGTQSHLPFGEQLSESSEQQKWKFTTYERDSETGDDYAINRGYWPTLGRFRQADPLAGSSGNPQSLNRNSYVGNNPVNFTDPLGLLRICLVGLFDIRRGDGPPLYYTQVIGCIDLPDIGLSGDGKPGVGGGKSKDPCHHFLPPEGFYPPDMLSRLLDAAAVANAIADRAANSTATAIAALLLAAGAPTAAAAVATLANGLELRDFKGIIGDPKGYFNPKAQNPAWDDAGNFLFGFMGTTAGIGREQLLRGSGYVKAYGSNSGDSVGKPTNELGIVTGTGGVYPYGNKWNGLAAIENGIRYAKCRAQHPFGSLPAL